MLSANNYLMLKLSYTGRQTAIFPDLSPFLTYKMDTIIKADESLCINCGSCIRACPGGLITKKDFPVPVIAAVNG